MTEIYRINTLAGELLVSADTGAKAVGFARRGITAERLSGAEVRALPADAKILDAHAADVAEAAGEGDDPSDFPIDAGSTDGGEG